MTGQERVKAAIHYQKVDRVPVQFYYTPVGFYEHGEQLNDLYATLPGDFQPFVRQMIPRLAPESFTADGHFHEYRQDEWGTVWEYRIFGVAGIPKKHPIASADEIDDYTLPPAPSLAGPAFTAFRQEIRRLSGLGYYTLGPCYSLYERLIALYGDENVLCDIALDEPAINRLANRIMAFNAQAVSRAVAAGCDGISFGDDYGSQQALLFSPACWRRFFKPRLQALFAPAVRAGLAVHFHSCGQIWPILADLKEIGVSSIWPQMPLYDMGELARHCRSLGLAVAIHTDRANTMTYGTPQMVRDLVRREYETFRMDEGGSWFYIEADNGFPFANIQALVETIREIRQGI